jgi:Arc/MetJ-type ribon-helix-helix transcriptional regulator
MKVDLKESKKLFTVRLPEAVVRDIKLLSVDTGKTVSELLTEAVTELVRKTGRTEVTYSVLRPNNKKAKK